MDARNTANLLKNGCLAGEVHHSVGVYCHSSALAMEQIYEYGIFVGFFDGRLYFSFFQ
jgi:hypothetical protein